MKHRIGFNALSRKSSQRKALMRSMVTSLLKYERIETTKAKALEVRKMAEKLITRGKVFKEIGPLFAERNGGYTRILKTGNRLGDAAEMVILELVEKTKKEEKAAKKADKKAETKAEAK